MKKIIETSDACGLDALLGEKVILLCANYFYAGTLTGVNDKFVQLSDAKIVYDTGEWSAKDWSDAQALPGGIWYVERGFIESYGAGK
jgi:hypothetical protein